MALRFIDSFDHYSATDLIGSGNGQKWSGINNLSLTVVPILKIASGRFLNCISMDNTGGGGTTFYLSKVLDNQPTWVIGIAFKTNSVTTGGVITSLFDSGTIQCELRMNSGGTLSVTRNGTALTSGTSSSSLTVNTWYYIEWLCTISNSISVNTCQVNVNGTNWINVATGQSTRNTSNNFANQINLGGGGGGGWGGVIISFDDLYLLDGTGSSPHNTFLGDCRVEARLPTSNSSINTAWTPSAGNAFGCVNDFAPNADQSFIASGTTNDISTFLTAPISSSPSTIYGLQLVHCSRKTDAGIRQIADTIRSGSTNYPNATPISLGTNYQYYTSPYSLDPNTSAAWTLSNVNSAEIGVKEIT